MFLIAIVIYVFPLYWAANYSDAEENSYSKCLILSVVLSIIQLIMYWLLPSNLLIANLLAAILNLIVCMKVLKIPGSNFFMFAIMLTFLAFLVQGIAQLIINGILAG